MKTATIRSLVLVFSAVLFGCSTGVDKVSSEGPKHISDLPLRYHNAEYGFAFFLPASWNGYSVLMQQWSAELYSPDWQKVIGMERGPVIVLRSPHWKASEPCQDIPIHVFTRSQWDADVAERFHIGAGGSDAEIAHNANYVLARSTRFNWGELKGFEEAGRIVDRNDDVNKPHLVER